MKFSGGLHLQPHQFGGLIDVLFAARIARNDEWASGGRRLIGVRFNQRNLVLQPSRSRCCEPFRFCNDNPEIRRTCPEIGRHCLHTPKCGIRTPPGKTGSSSPISWVCSVLAIGGATDRSTAAECSWLYGEGLRPLKKVYAR